jgi:alkanesulfonate monooxygenase SsuD/methylene tetrahydromethanopterin reductase-like flavin-dependent oxidoreductase (luciferase family)
VPESEAATYQRNTRINNSNRFKLGLFAMNCSCGSVATTAPEQWHATWDDNVEAARLADQAGLEFLLPVARWHGYGGLTDRQGTSFETLTWATGLLGATQDIVTFATVHTALINPVFAAKQVVTADHVGRGRCGLNVVSGWNVGEFDMFGTTMLEHDTRYAYTEEWLTIAKRIWAEDQPFDFKGAHFDLKGVISKPKPYGGGRPALMSAGSSGTGRAFAVRNADCLFMVIVDVDKLTDEITALRAAATDRSVGVFTSGHMICRRTEKEARDYHHYIVREKGDWEAAEKAIAKRFSGGTQSIPKDKLLQMQERFISGGGTFPVIGSFDQAAEIYKRLADAGLNGMAVGLVNYVQEMPYIRDELLPRMQRLGLREAAAAR